MTEGEATKGMGRRRVGAELTTKTTTEGMAVVAAEAAMTAEEEEEAMTIEEMEEIVTEKIEETGPQGTTERTTTTRGKEIPSNQMRLRTRRESSMLTT